MRKILTKDQSYTLHNTEYDETYHSVTGAIEESEKKFVEPCGIKPEMRILDICFGLGYNVLAAIHKTKTLEIVSLEKDEKVINEMQKINVPKEYSEDYEIVKIAAREKKYSKKDLNIKIILGDASKTINEVKGEFDAVFLDPFSPPKNPELWTEGFFKELYRLIKKDGILATYSCAKKVRVNLKNAGFKVMDGPCVGRRSPSTIAQKI